MFLFHFSKHCHSDILKDKCRGFFFIIFICGKNLKQFTFSDFSATVRERITGVTFFDKTSFSNCDSKGYEIEKSHVLLGESSEASGSP